MDTYHMNAVSRLSPIAANQGGQGITSQRTRDRMIERLRSQGISDARVLEAMSKVPRHLYVDEGLQSRAYDDSALPIGLGQTISQPWVVARMTELLIGHFGRRPKKVLEVGTGCGYQAAVLAQLVDEVYTVERLDELLRGARRRLRHQGISNVRSKHADGLLGWPECAPFDAALLAAGGSMLDAEFFAQIAPGGVVVVPLGGPAGQMLTVFRHGPAGWSREEIARVMFVPLLAGVR